MRIRLLISVITLMIATAAFAQDVSKQVIGSTGILFTNGTYTLNFTVGESVVGLVENNVAIHQGFWTSYTNDETLSITESSPLISEITYYPNPVVSDLIVNFKTEASGDFNIALYDISGRKVYSETLNSDVETHIISMTALSDGTYVLQITSHLNSYNKSIKILKNK